MRKTRGMTEGAKRDDRVKRESSEEQMQHGRTKEGKGDREGVSIAKKIRGHPCKHC